MKAENLGFKCLRRLGTGCMHLTIVSICLLLSADVCFSFKFAVESYPVWLRIPLQILFGFVALNYFSAYFMAIFVDPGHPPEPNQMHPVCQKCYLAKPNRAHHCSMCGKCCLRYDHHCPWIANCVGLRNYCHFLKFVNYGMVAGAMSTLMSVISLLVGRFGISSIKDQALRVLLSIIMPIFSFVSGLCAGVMAFTHYPQVRRNETTVECYENEVESRRARKLGMTFQYPYDNGVLYNVREIFGQNWAATMLIPFMPPLQKCDGLSYKPSINCGL